MSVRQRLLLGTVLATALVLRWIGLAGQGIANYDEAAHLLEARFFRLRFLHPGDTWPAILEGLPLFHAKPLHAALLAVVQALAGDHPWAGGIVSGLFGTATVYLVYRLGRKLWGANVGLLASAMLAALPWAVLYGRMALAEADSAFFVLLSATIQLEGWPRRSGAPTGNPASERGRALLRTAAAGAVASLAFLANYRWGVFLLLQFIGIELLGRRWRTFPLRLLAWGACAAAPLFLADVIYEFGVLGPLLDAANRPRTYIEDLAHNFFKFEAMGVGVRDPLRLPLFLWVFGGRS